MDDVRRLKRQRNLLLLVAFPVLPFVAIYSLISKARKRRSQKALLTRFSYFHRREENDICSWLEEYRSDLIERLAKLFPGYPTKWLEEARQILSESPPSE